MTSLRIAAEADRCVKCGLCLPHCPTYRETHNESESPRGRIALAQGWIEGHLTNTPSLQRHFALCLECLACEPVCPSGVAFGELMDEVRAESRRSWPAYRRWWQGSLLRFLSEPAWLRSGATGIRSLQRYPRLWSGFQGLASALVPPLNRLFQLMPDFPPALERSLRYPPSVSPERGEVAIFPGCVTSVCDTEVIRAAIRVLNRLGFQVRIPEVALCCGAMHQHNGEPERAMALAQRNLEVFADPRLEAVLSIASGCGSQLARYDRLPGIGASAQAKGFVERHRDINGFLQSLAWPEDLRLRPLPLSVAVHDPCSLRNSLGQSAAVYRLLARIPEIRLSALEDNAFCCGAAGTYVLQQPEMSDRLLARKIAALRAASPDVLVTSNTGCALQLQAGIKAAGLTIPVLHAVQLIARQLPQPDASSGGEHEPAGLAFPDR